jgi:hypothetical protein
LSCIGFRSWRSADDVGDQARNRVERDPSRSPARLPDAADVPENKHAVGMECRPIPAPCADALLSV